jgi:hypothetical protein
MPQGVRYKTYKTPRGNAGKILTKPNMPAADDAAPTLINLNNYAATQAAATSTKVSIHGAGPLHGIEHKKARA